MNDSAWWQDATLLGVPVDDSVMVRFVIVQAVWNAEALQEEVSEA